MNLIDLPYEQIKFLPFEAEIIIDGEKGNYEGTADDKRGSLGYTLKALLNGDKSATKRLKGKRVQITRIEYEKSIKWFKSVIESAKKQDI